MILLYTLTLSLLGLARLLFAGRATFLEKRYAALARSVLKLGHEPVLRGGNAAKADAFASAKRTFELGRLVQKRDAVEAKYMYWRGLADRMARAADRVTAWKGQKLPYTFGVVDVGLALYLVDYLGVDRYLSVKQVVDQVIARVGW